MASAYRSMGNYSKALEYYLEELKMAEHDGKAEDLAIIYMNISNVYQEEGDHSHALSYALMSNEIIERDNIEFYKFYSYFNLGDIYEKLNDIEKALFNTYKAYSIASTKNDPYFIGICFNNLGNIYSKSGKQEMALKQYLSGIPYLSVAKSESDLCETYIGMSKLYDAMGVADSGIYYARRSYEIAVAGHFNKRVLTASSALAAFYKKQGVIDSAFAYQSKLLEVKDSIYSQDKVKQLQNLTTDEKLRQKEINELKQQEAEDRRKRLQLLLVGLLIPLSFLISILLSKRKIRPRIVEFSGIVSLLLFFEYITLLLHPWVKEVTHHNAFFEIIIFVGIAAIITPSHHRIEHWMITKLTYRRSHKHSDPE
jgi:tetratricopeptide (TPR) repeat protein